ncbi:MAG TPA: acyl-CoA thioesterase [Fibrobacteria bacterium]|nr:acyl-CoA thioesterase [Fibrobacteria bacterium]
MNPATPRPPSESRVLTFALMMPEHANHLGHVHGGWIMKLVDEAGGLAATRHARRPVVTVAVEGMVFHRPVPTGSVLRFEASVVAVGRSSLDVVVDVQQEDPIAGTLERVHTANMVYVALGDDDRPAPVPPLSPETPQELERHRAAMDRRAARVRG